VFQISVLFLVPRCVEVDCARAF